VFAAAASGLRSNLAKEKSMRRIGSPAGRRRKSENPAKRNVARTRELIRAAQCAGFMADATGAAAAAQ